jgi:type VI secretion system protein ImpC
MEEYLNRWINQFVTTDPNAGDQAKSERPLADANVVVEEVPGNPGYYTSKIWLRPHFQLEGLTVSLRLVSKLKAPGGK